MKPQPIPEVVERVLAELNEADSVHQRNGHRQRPLVTLAWAQSLDGSIANTFPGQGAFSAFANLTMETFSQTRAQLGCMSCHDRARMTTDVMWSVFDHAHPGRLAAAPR